MPPAIETSTTTPLRQLIRDPRLKKHGRTALIVLAINFSIAGMMTAIGVPGGFVDCAKISNAIGFCIWGISAGLRSVTRDRVPIAVLALCTLPVGLVVGSKLAAWAGASDLLGLAATDSRHPWRWLIASVLVALLGTCFIIFYLRGEALRADLQVERRRSAEALQSEATAQLALLQAQIEPHFLFNTLANVQSVIESDPRTARAILDHLTRYLRVNLGRTRRPSTRLDDELDLIGALLGIAKLRLQDRLRYTISVVPEELRKATLPPLLLQPLVENALKHGIEPSVAGGEIRIEVRRANDSLEMRVKDSGVGPNPSSPEGVGLMNVRARLASLYGQRGRLALYQNEPTGVVAELTIPLQGL